MLHQALSLCSSLVEEACAMKRPSLSRFDAGDPPFKCRNRAEALLPEMNARVNELLRESIKSEGVINLFSDVKQGISLLFDPKFLEEIANMKEKNLAVELLKKLIAEQVSVTGEPMS